MLLLLGRPGDECDRLAAGTAVLLETCRRHADTAPLRLGLFGDVALFETHVDLLRPGDCAVIGNAADAAAVKRVLERYSLASKGPSRRSRDVPVGPFFMVVCTTRSCPWEEELRRFDRATLAKLLLMTAPWKPLQEFADRVQRLVLQCRDRGCSFTEVQPADGERPPLASVSIRGQVHPFETTRTLCEQVAAHCGEVSAGTVAAVSSRLALLSLRLAAQRFSRRYGPGGFLVRFVSLEACRAGLPERLGDSILRQAAYVELLVGRAAGHERAAACRAEIHEEVRKCVIPFEGASFDDCVAFVPLKTLASLKPDMRRNDPDHRLIFAHDAERCCLVCGEVGVGTSQGRTLVSFSCIAFGEGGREGEPGSRPPPAVPATGPVGVVQEPGAAAAHAEIEAAVARANAEAKARKSARKRRDFAGQAPAVRPPAEPAPPERAPAKLKPGKPGRPAPKADEDEARRMAKLLQLVQARLAAMPPPSESAVESPPARKKPPSANRQRRLTLGLPTFQACA